MDKEKTQERIPRNPCAPSLPLCPVGLYRSNFKYTSKDAGELTTKSTPGRAIFLENTGNQMRFSAVVALAFGAISFASSFAAEVGTTAGEFSVGASGSANYSIPISVPPGIGGMAPSVSIQYDASSADGIVGRGFSLAGLSQITRCNRNKADDNYLKGIEFNATDAFCLDGQRLVAITGSYGAVGTEYRTQIDSFSKIVSSGGVAGDPQFWTVYTKSGLVMQFGYTADSRIEADSRSQALFWGANRIADTVGNAMTISYLEYGQTGLPMPSQIIYASGRARVDFEYEYRNDPFFRFVGGAFIRNEYRLKKISTWAVDRYTREYRLAYSSTSPGGVIPKALGSSTISQLTTITECDPRSGTCLNPTGFDWALPPSSSVSYGAAHYVSSVTADASRDIARIGYGDFNGDGRTDVYRIDSSNNSSPISIFQYRQDGGQDNAQGPSVYVSADAQQFYKDINRVKAADLNGDGLTDFLILNGTGSVTASSVYLRTTNGFSGPTNGPSYLINSDARRGKADTERFRIVDLNGDGLPDIHVVSEGSAASTIYNNQGGGVFALGVVGPTFSVGASTGSTDDVSFDQARIRYGDFNGDGLTDIYVLEGCNANTPSTIWFSSASGFTRKTTNYNHYADCGNIANRINDLNRSIQGDFNGDGLTDFIYIGGYGTTVNSEIIYSRGDGTFYKLTSLPFYVGGSTAGVQLDVSRIKVADLNADGMSDILYLGGYNSSTTTRYINKGWGNFTSSPGPDHYITGDVDRATMDVSRVGLTDVNGDGALEMYVLTGNGSSLATPLRHLGLNSSERIAKITNGMGAVTQIDYKSLTDASVHTRASASAYPTIAIQSPMYVVSLISSSDGLGGVRQIEHSYAGAALNLQGRGFLGFATHTEFDRGTRIRQVSTFRQDFPYIGMPSSVVTKTEAGVLVSEEITSYLSRNIATNGATRYFPYVSSQTQRDYEINSPGTVARSEVTTNTYGEADSVFFGNLTGSTTQTRPGAETSGASPFVTTTTNLYTNDTSRWWLGRLTRSTVSKYGPSQTQITRTSAFEYSPTTGLLTAEIVEPLSATMMLRKAYLRDGYGNIYSTTLSGSDVTARTSTTAFDSARQFPTGVTNALGQTSYMLHDPATGSITQSTDANGLVTMWQYDGFGRKKKETRADGTTTTWVRTFGSGNLYVPNGTYTISASSSDGSTAAAIYDVLDRPVGTQSLAFSGSYSRTLTTYDNAGRMVSRTMPFFDSAVGCSATWTYDPIGRPKTMTSPENGGNCAGRVTQYNFGVRTSSVIDALGRTTLQEVDALGRIGRTEDGNRFSTYFSYDAYGNQTRVVDGMGNTTSIQYDLRGRKVLMDDPDMGVWSYGYNAFGELVKQTDAKNQIVTHTYDALGRMTARSELEGNSNWWYDKDSTGLKCWTGALCESISPNGRNHKLFKYDYLGRLSKLTDTIGLVGFTGAPEVSLTAPLQIPDTPTSGPSICPITDLSCGVARLVSDNTETTTNPRSLVSQYTYDGQSRVSTVKYGEEIIVGYSYNPRGYLEKLYNQYSNLNLWTAQAHDARGNIVQHLQGNNVTTSKNFDEGTGELDAIYASGGYGVIQNLLYQRDKVGNITRRTDSRLGGKYESYSYDALNRLTSSNVSSGSGSQYYNYNAIGNIMARTGAGNYRYSAERPHAVVNVGNNGGPTAFYDYKYSVDFQYDANGNLLVGAGRIYTWNSFNKPEQIQRGAEGSRFEYDADRARVLEVQTRITDGTPQVTEILTSGAYERRITTNGALQDRVHVSAGGGLVAVLTSGAAEVLTPGINAAISAATYIHGDHQGNVEAVTNSLGQAIDRTSFDPFGARRETDWSSDPDYSESKRSHPTDRGYTGHHQPDHLQLIHMNGRVYDPYLARFVSADPYIQDPNNSQSLNRYSYVWNNPVNSTDPSGYWNLWKHTRDIKHWAQDNRRAIYAIAITVTGQYYAYGALATYGGFAAAGIAGASGFAAGYVGSGGNLKAALIGGVTSAAFFGVGQAYQGANSSYALGSGRTAMLVEKTIVHGVVGGLSSRLQGSGFGSGFLAASVPAGYQNAGFGAQLGSLAGYAESALLGGTASVLGGGKFANGAITATMAYAFNAALHGTLADRDRSMIRSMKSDIATRLEGEYYEDYASQIPDLMAPDQRFEESVWKGFDPYAHDRSAIEAVTGTISTNMPSTLGASSIGGGLRKLFGFAGALQAGVRSGRAWALHMNGPMVVNQANWEVIYHRPYDNQIAPYRLPK